jgi:hypothetical protein
MKLIGRIERHLPEPIKDRIYNLCKNHVDYYNNGNNWYVFSSIYNHFILPPATAI